MAANITRRTFIKSGAVLGASSTLGSGATGWLRRTALAAGPADIAAVKGMDYFQNTLKAVEALGGMGRFVSKQSRVGLLINSPWNHPGSYVKPEIALAVIQMCLEAGAGEIVVFKNLSNSYWRRSPLSTKLQDEVNSVKNRGGNYREVSLPGGRSLKKAEIAKGLLDCDVFINIPISKDHTGVRITGALKNMMGATSGGTNSFFHHGSGASGYYDDVEFLSRCIADVNLVRKPDLCVYDGTEILQSNGPGGPGKLVKPQKVFAGVDRVALEVYGANLLGLKGDGILSTRMAHEHGLGEIDLTKLKVREISI